MIFFDVGAETCIHGHDGSSNERNCMQMHSFVSFDLPVAKLTTLRHLDVWKCHIQNHSVLAPLRGLTELVIEPQHPAAWYNDMLPSLVVLTDM